MRRQSDSREPERLLGCWMGGVPHKPVLPPVHIQVVGLPPWEDDARVDQEEDPADGSGGNGGNIVGW